MTRWDDDQLQALLAAALLDTEPVPDSVLRNAKEAFTWRTIDAELAELVFDSSRDQLAGVRGETSSRQVTFRAPGVDVELMIVAEGVRRLVGQLVPPQSAAVELRHGDQVREGATDDLGRFSFSDVPVGPIQLSVETPSGGKVVTEWMVA